jgi:hypothetical protein
LALEHHSRPVKNYCKLSTAFIASQYIGTGTLSSLVFICVLHLGTFIAHHLKMTDTTVWIQDNNTDFNPSLRKHELLEMLMKIKSVPVYTINKILKETGFTALQLPPYHLNPIKLIRANLLLKLSVPFHCPFLTKLLEHQCDK